MHISLRGPIATVLLLCGLMSSPVWAGEVSVAVASDFAAPMERLVPLFQKESGHTVKVSTGRQRQVVCADQGRCGVRCVSFRRRGNAEAIDAGWFGGRRFALRLCHRQAGVVECAARFGG